MIMRQLLNLFVSLIILIGITNATADISLAVGSVASSLGFFSALKWLNCRITECCDKPWVKLDLQAMKDNLSKKVFGQHLVTRTVGKAVEAHIVKRSPQKALVLSFHGWTGSGKSYVSRILIDSLFQLGFKSQYVKWFIGSKDFAHDYDLPRVKKELQETIERTVDMCEYSVFVFEEVDKMVPGVLEAVSTYVDFHEGIAGINFRRSIFIFISNSGGKEINDMTFAQWSTGRPRDEITLEEAEVAIMKPAYNSDGGLKRSGLIKGHLIDHFIPFLPLERSVVELCVNAYTKSLGVSFTRQQVDKVLNSLTWFPSDVNLFASHGCKQVEKKVDLVIETDDIYPHNRLKTGTEDL